MTQIEEIGTGTVLAGHRIEGVLGRGGMGIVYSAVHIGLDTPRALKVIVPALAGKQEFRERFRREARLAASLQHRHVVTIHDTGEENGVLYISMQRVNGADLSQLLAERGRLDPGEATDLLGQIAAALDAAHQRGLVHRDVKPANVLVEEGTTGQCAYATDFGLTKPIASESGFTETGMAVGSVDYMAPEQFNGARLDARTDVYSLGAVYFATLAGEVPFPAENPAQKMFGHTNREPPSIREHAPELSPELDAVIRQAMAKDPDDRFQSAGDLGRAATAALTGEALTPPTGSVATGEAATGVLDAVPETTQRMAPVASRTERVQRTPAEVLEPERSFHPPPRPPDDPTGALRTSRSGSGRRALAVVGILALVGAAVAAVVLLSGSSGDKPGKSPDLTPAAGGGGPKGDKGSGAEPEDGETAAATQSGDVELAAYSPSNSAYDYTAKIPSGSGWSSPSEEEVTAGHNLRTTVEGPDGLVVSIDRTPNDPPSFGYSFESEKTLSHPTFDEATEYTFSGNDAFPQCVDSTCVDIQVDDFSGGGWAVLAGGVSDVDEAERVARAVANTVR